MTNDKQIEAAFEAWYASTPLETEYDGYTKESLQWAWEAAIAASHAQYVLMLVEALREVREIYAGMEGFIPETAPEGYLQQVIKQMYNEAVEALANLPQELR